jgi:hypothetical protein
MLKVAFKLQFVARVSLDKVYRFARWPVEPGQKRNPIFYNRQTGIRANGLNLASREHFNLRDNAAIGHKMGL